MLKYLIMAATLLGLESCATVDQALAPQPGLDTISITAGPHYGASRQVSELMISSDGRVRFQGRRSSEVKSLIVGQEGYQGVAAALASYRLPNAIPACSEWMTHADSYTIVWTDPTGASTTLEHYAGAMCPESQELTRILMTIPTMLGVAD